MRKGAWPMRKLLSFTVLALSFGMVLSPLSLAQGFGSRWRTDFSKHSVPLDEIISGGPPKDGIPSIDNPKFVSFDEADEWLKDVEPVIILENKNVARAYPLQILTWHEIVNDLMAGDPVAITFCPLCNSAIAFDGRLDGMVYDFGTTGRLRNSDLVMYDRQTESWWQQFTGEAIVGELTGKKLKMLPASIVSYADFKRAYPNGSVLSRDTGFSRPYGRNPYVGYDRIDNTPFLYTGELDRRLLPMERVVAVTVGDVDKAYPFSVVSEKRVINDSINGSELVLFHSFGTSSALDRDDIASSRDVGATGVFEPYVDGRKLTFVKDGDLIKDKETGSAWSVLGKAISGSLAGKSLKPIVHANHFAFVWLAFKPDTLIYKP